MGKSVNELKSTSERIGQLYPILVDFYGNIVDGQHRFDANPKWTKMQLNHIKTKKDRIIAKIISNNVRRYVCKEEKRKLMGELGDIFLREGIAVGKIAYEISSVTGMSYRWVMKYLPNTFKDELQANRRKGLVAHHATKVTSFRDPPEGAVSIQLFKNTNFISFTVEKSLYTKIEKKAKTLKMSPSKLMYNAILRIINLGN